MPDIALKDALLLWDSGLNDEAPRFAIRPIGHPDYDSYAFKVGACFTDWRQESDLDRLKLRFLIEIWHIVAFHDVPASLMRDALLVVPEYRDMLADDCLPKQFRFERN